MNLNENGSYPISKKIIFFMGSILLVKIVSAHKCFVCGPNIDKEDLIPSCDRFNPNDPIFIRECVLESKGCSIQTNGTVHTRTCEPFALVDCKKANHIEYCYCNFNLCNKFHPTRVDEEDVDSETEEGSGKQPLLLDVTRVMHISTTSSSTTPANIITQSEKSSQLNLNQSCTLLSFSTFLIVYLSNRCYNL